MKMKPKRRRKNGDAGEDDDEIEEDAIDEGPEEELFGRQEEEEDEEEEEEDFETVEEKRVRMAREYLERVKEGLRVGKRLDKEKVNMKYELAAGKINSNGKSPHDDNGYNDDLGGYDDNDDDEMIGDALKKEVLREDGRQHRKIASRIRTSSRPDEVGTVIEQNGTRFLKNGHKMPITALALSDDESTVFSSAKDSTIFKWDVETGKKVSLQLKINPQKGNGRRNLSNVATGTLKVGKDRTIMCMAVSSDSRYLAAGGTGEAVHVWDVRIGGQSQHLGSMPGHRASITSCSFRDGTSELFTGSADRTIKMWNLGEMAYVDTLYGHGAEVVAVDVGRRERVLSCGRDRTCRIWKIPEETQLVYQGGGVGIESAVMVTPTQWITGGDDGSLSLWSQLKKKPTVVVRDAHKPLSHELGGHATKWVGAVAASRNSDLITSGAGDGKIAFWCAGSTSSDSSNAFRSLKHIGNIEMPGFVNGMAIGSSGRLLVAGVGQEQRWGRWARVKSAKNGLLITALSVDDQ